MHPFGKDSVWGHVSRNAYMTIKFAEFMNPSIDIKRVYYNKGLMMDLLIKGCI